MEKNIFDSDAQNNYTQVNLNAKKIFKLQSKIILCLLAIHIVGLIIKRFIPDFMWRDGIIYMFYFDGELNIPSVYSALALLCSSLIIAVITYLKSRMHDRYTNYWKCLGILFLFLSFDEFVSLHERMIDPTKALLNTSGLFYFAWVIPGSIGVLICFLIFLNFLLNLPRKTRNHFLLAGFTYISGCIGCELIGGYIVDKQLSNSLYLIIMTIEETLEMLGVAIFIYGLISHISDYTKGATFEIIIPGKKANFL